MINPAKKAYKGRLLLNLIPIFRQSGADVSIATTETSLPLKREVWRECKYKWCGTATTTILRDKRKALPYGKALHIR